MLSDYGIDINSSRIKIKGNGSQTTIVLGDETRDAQGMFVQIEEYESFRGAIWKASKDLISIASASPVFLGQINIFYYPNVWDRSARHHNQRFETIRVLKPSN